MVRGDPVCRKEDCSRYDIDLVFKEINSYLDQDKLKFIENVWKPRWATLFFLNKSVYFAAEAEPKLNVLIFSRFDSSADLSKVTE